MNDWNLIKNWYRITEIGRVATQFRTLDPKALTFLVNITGLPLNKFRCYTTKHTFDSLTYKGFLNFFAKNTRFAMGEFLSLLSKSPFVVKSKKLITDIEEYMFVKGGIAGVRAQAISPQGDLIMDFNILKENNQIHVLNSPSPGQQHHFLLLNILFKIIFNSYK